MHISKKSCNFAHNSVQSHYKRMKHLSKYDYMLLSIEEMKKSRQEGRDDNKVSPKVGAVLVRKDESYVSAHRGEIREGDHAEFTLLERKCTAEDVTGLEVYTTLEPCCERHLPKVSCSQRLIKARVKKVYIGIEDPDPTVSGNGIRRLQEHGIEVEMYPPELQKIIEEENKLFLEGAFNRRKQKPITAPTSNPLLQPIRETTISDLDSVLIDEFLDKINTTHLPSEEGINALLKLNIISQQGEKICLTGLGLLLFGKQPQLIYPNAVIRATYRNNGEEIDLPTFEGPLVRQSTLLFDWYKEKIHSHIDRSTPERTRIYDYPIDVINELVKNAIAHRDYSIMGANIYFEIDEKKIILKSPGEPISPISIQQIKDFNAPSLSRNPLIMFVFDKLGLAEQRGLGFNTIRKLPKNQVPVVTFDAPNIVITIPLTSNGPVKKVTIEDGLAFIKERGLVTRQDYQDHFELTVKTAIRQINKLIESGDIIPIGKGKDTQYKPAE